MHDLVDEVVDHVAREVQLAVAQQPDLNEVAVPPVHFVEAAARHDVGTREVEQAMFPDRQHVARQRADLDLPHRGGVENLSQFALDAGTRFVRRHVEQPAAAGPARHLRIGKGAGKVAVRARQGGPAAFDVRAEPLEKRLIREALRVRSVRRQADRRVGTGSRRRALWHREPCGAGLAS